MEQEHGVCLEQHPSVSYLHVFQWSCILLYSKYNPTDNSLVVLSYSLWLNYQVCRFPEVYQPLFLLSGVPRISLRRKPVSLPYNFLKETSYHYITGPLCWNY